MKYSIVVNPHIEKTLSKVNASDARRIRDQIRNLPIDPRPSNSIKMKGEGDTYRVRVGDYRIIYEIHDKKLLILVINVGHRRDVYKRR